MKPRVVLICFALLLAVTGCRQESASVENDQSRPPVNTARPNPIVVSPGAVTNSATNR